MMRGIVLAAVLGVLAISRADATAWCGYGAHAKSLIECGYSSDSECESAVGKGGVCFVDPEYAMKLKQMTPSPAIPRRSAMQVFPQG
jgi:hypothetical protein